MPTLDEHKQLISDLWLDQPDAHERIDERLAAGAFSSKEAERLHGFVDDGFMMLPIGVDQTFADHFEADVARMFAERPPDLAIAGKRGDRTSFRDSPEEYAYSRGYRIADLHSHSPKARDLYLHPDLFRYVRLIFDAEPIAFQSLYFQFGSEQALHRDPMFVVTKPPSHLVAAWIALEDITAESGPLIYAPGSHRMPWFEFEPDKISVAVKSAAKDKRVEWANTRKRLLNELDLEVKEFTPKQGDAFIWHGSLLHGGAKRRDETSTRKSFVVHYSTADNYKSRRATMKALSDKSGEPQLVSVGGTTDRVLEQAGCRGIDNPLREARLPPLGSRS